MSSDLQPEFQRELQRLPPDSLRVPAGLYERVAAGAALRRRQRRLRVGAAGAVLAVAAVMVGVFGFNGSTRDTLVPVAPASVAPTPGSSLVPTPSPVPSSTPSPAGAEPRFIPQSVSFISADDGWAFGPQNAAGEQGPTNPGVLAVTHDAGQTWTQLPAPAIGYAAGDRVRFLDANRGYLYGDKLYTTTDGGRHWRQLAAPGRVIDLRVAGRLYLLVDHCQALVPTCPKPGLYSSTLDGAKFTETALSGWADGAQLSAFGSTLYVFSPSLSPSDPKAVLLSTTDGVHFTQSDTPCDAQASNFGSVAAFGNGQLALVCGGQPSAGIQPKTAYVSNDGGLHWTQRGFTSSFPAGGYVGPLAVLDDQTWLLGEARGPMLLTHDGGGSWGQVTVPGVTGADGWGDVQFAGTTHAVGVPSDLYGNGIALSPDVGDSWTFHRFTPR